MPTKLIMTDTQKSELSLQFTDVHGHPTGPPPGGVTWESSDPSIVGIEPHEKNPQGCFAVSQGQPGTAQVTGKTTVDGNEIVKLLPTEVVASAATGVDIIAGTPVEIEGGTTPPGQPGQQPHPDHTLPGDLPHPEQRPQRR